jgi:hypothetical protein
VRVRVRVRVRVLGLGFGFRFGFRFGFGLGKDLLGGVLGAGRVVFDELFTHADVLGPLALVYGARRHLGSPQHGPWRVC